MKQTRTTKKSIRPWPIDHCGPNADILGVLGEASIRRMRRLRRKTTQKIVGWVDSILTMVMFGMWRLPAVMTRRVGSRIDDLVLIVGLTSACCVFGRLASKVCPINLGPKR